MISPHKTPALAKLAMLLLFAIATVAILDTTSISAQELGKTITSPFGVANPYMNTSDSSESGSDGDIFVDPETGEGGHIIRNPFGQAADPEMDNTDSDTFEEEDEGDEFFISLPDENAVGRNDSKRDEEMESADSAPANTPKSGGSNSSNIVLLPDDPGVGMFELSGKNYYCIKKRSTNWAEITFCLKTKRGSNQGYIEYELAANEFVTWHLINSKNAFVPKHTLDRKKIVLRKFSFNEESDWGQAYIVEAILHKPDGDIPIRTNLVLPSVTLKSVTFHHNRANAASHALFYKNDQTASPVEVPEYVQSNSIQNTSSTPVLYSRGQTPTVKVDVEIQPSFLQEVSLTGSNSASDANTTIKSFSNPNQTTDCEKVDNVVSCYVPSTRPINSGFRKTKLIIKWETKSIHGAAFNSELVTTIHENVYVILGSPKFPWGNESSGATTTQILDYLFVNHELQNGMTENIQYLTNAEQMVEGITRILYYSNTGTSVDDESTTSYYAAGNNGQNTFYLDNFVSAINQGGALSVSMNSRDYALALSLLSKVVGINALAKQQDPWKEGKKHSFCVYKSKAYDASHNYAPDSSHGLNPFGGSESEYRRGGAASIPAGCSYIELIDLNFKCN